MTFPRSLSADDRETVRQIAQHFDCTHKVISEGNEKEIKVFKPDFTRFEVVEAEQDAKTQEIDFLKDQLLNAHLCLGLTQSTLSRDQRKCRVLAKEVELLHRLVKDPRNHELAQKLDDLKKSNFKIGDECSRCERHIISHAVFPCGHVFCKTCADEARSSLDCGACGGTVEGVLEIQDAVTEPEPKKSRI